MKLTGFCLSIVCLVGLMGNSKSINHRTINRQESNSISATLSNDKLFAGMTIEPVLEGIKSENIDFKWFVNDKNVSNQESFKLTPNQFESFIKVECYEKGTNNYLTSSNTVYFSKLPVVYLNDEFDKFGKVNKYYTFDGELKIQGNAKFDKQYEGSVTFKGRGSLSWTMPKKPVKLKLDKKTNLFGFGKTKHYVLLNNYIDSAGIRTSTAFELSKILGLITPDYQYVDLIYNGKYLGLYLLTEHVRIGKQLVDITDYEDIAGDIAKEVYKANKTEIIQDEFEDYLVNNLSWVTKKEIIYNGKKYDLSEYMGDIPSKIDGGFLFEMTHNKKEGMTFKTNKGIEVIVSRPEMVKEGDGLYEIARETIQDLEDALMSKDGYNSKGQYFADLVDIESMASYLLINEILANEDSSRRSRFCYKDNGGKIIFGPIWDVDTSANSWRSFFNNPKGFKTVKSLATKTRRQGLFEDVFKFEEFQTVFMQKYFQVRSHLKRMFFDDGDIDKILDYVYESAMQNDALYSSVTGYHKTRMLAGKNGDLQCFKKFINSRIDWLDKYFNCVGLEIFPIIYTPEPLCEHELIEVNETEVTNDRYGINRCSYCCKCEHYYNGNDKLYAHKIITPVKETKHHHWFFSQAVSAGLGFLGINSAILFILFFVIKHKRRKRYFAQIEKNS